MLAASCLLTQEHMLSADGENGPAEGASYWASLLSDFAGHLREEEEDELSKGLRKRHRTERAAAALAGRRGPHRIFEVYELKDTHKFMPCLSKAVQSGACPIKSFGPSRDEETLNATCLYLNDSISAAGPESSLGLPSDAEDGEDGAVEGYDGRKASSGLMSPTDAGGGNDEQGTRYRSGRGSRGRAATRGRGSRRRKADDDDDASEIFEDMKGPHKRRKRGRSRITKARSQSLRIFLE